MVDDAKQDTIDGEYGVVCISGIRSEIGYPVLLNCQGKRPKTSKSKLAAAIDDASCKFSKERMRAVSSRKRGCELSSIAREPNF